MEYRYGMDGAPKISKGNLEHLVSSIERVLPHLKGQLTLIRHEISAWKVTYTVQHAKPLLPSWAHLLAHGMLTSGYPFVGAACCYSPLLDFGPANSYRSLWMIPFYLVTPVALQALGLSFFLLLLGQRRAAAKEFESFTPWQSFS